MNLILLNPQTVHFNAASMSVSIATIELSQSVKVEYWVAIVSERFTRISEFYYDIKFKISC
jgi:hypothetical protein